MKNEKYLELLPMEKQLKSAVASSYARLSSAEFEQFCSIYAELYGVELTRNEKNCNVCRLKALVKVAKDYFEYQNWYLNRWGRRPEDPKPEEINNEEKEQENA